MKTPEEYDYRREVMTHDVRQTRLSDIEEELLESLIRPRIRAIMDVEEPLPKLERIMLGTLFSRAREHAKLEDAQQGVRTRLGYHLRYRKLKKGKRSFPNSEGVYTWWVVHVNPGWLETLEAKADMFGTTKWEQREGLDYEVGRRVYEATGGDVTSDEDWSDGDWPSATRGQVGPGEWFSRLDYRQVGHRLLVIEYRAQNI